MVLGSRELFLRVHIPKEYMYLGPSIKYLLL